jgi:hypothetical protein
MVATVRDMIRRRPQIQRSSRGALAQGLHEFFMTVIQRTSFFQYREALSAPLPSSICGVSTMRHASFATSIASSTPAISQNQPTRKSLFASLIEALHHSRRLQAQRVIGQYRDLIARYEPADATSTTQEEAKLSIYD